MKSTTTYYREARKIKQRQQIAARLADQSGNGCFTDQDRIIAAELMRQFIAEEM